MVKNILDKFSVLGYNMNLKLHFLNARTNYFLANLGALNKEQGGTFFQDLKESYRSYQGPWDVNMMVVYDWTIAR